MAATGVDGLTAHRKLPFSSLTRFRARAPFMVENWPMSSLMYAINHNQVDRAFVGQSYVNTITKAGDTHVTRIFASQIESVVHALETQSVEFSMIVPNALQVAIVQLIPWMVVFYVISSFIRGSFMTRFKTNIAKDVESAASDTTFDDVAGELEVKRELVELVDFLKTPERFERVGAKIPSGVLMEGPPGTGKTLLARAVAGEANVPFFAMSGSDFVELYVGLGAARVRQLFAKAKEMAPSVIFIDEIDAVGKKRAGGAAAASGNDEREQTLNAILSEMDGFESDAQVVVIACTNLVDALDPALLRSGRFDRRVRIGLPSTRVRAQIARVHAANKPIEESIDFDDLGALTAGLSGADIATMFNEAAINAARDNRDSIRLDDVTDAIDKLTLGPTAGRDVTNSTRRLVAVHEAGHAVVGVVQPAYDDVLRRVTIRPRSNGVGGFTQFVPLGDRIDGGLYSKEYLEARLDVLLGGRVAEEVVFGEAKATTGAASDLAQAQTLARSMAIDWGFYGPVSSNDAEDKVVSIVEKSFERVRSVLARRRQTLERIATMLEQSETVDGKAVVDNVINTT